MNVFAIAGFLFFQLQVMTVTVFDFSKLEHVEAWTIVDDGVMGGVSQGSWYQEDDYAVFEGDISLENNGGFSSLRIGFSPVDLSAFDGIELTVRGDGQTYAFGLRDRDFFNAYDYRLSFETDEAETIHSTDEDWQTIYIPFEDVVATSFGREVPDAAPLNTSRVRGMTLIISDKQEGTFRLEIAGVALYTESEDENPPTE